MDLRLAFKIRIDKNNKKKCRKWGLIVIEQPYFVRTYAPMPYVPCHVSISLSFTDKKINLLTIGHLVITINALSSIRVIFSISVHCIRVVPHSVTDPIQTIFSYFTGISSLETAFTHIMCWSNTGLWEGERDRERETLTIN